MVVLVIGTPPVSAATAFFCFLHSVNYSTCGRPADAIKSSVSFQKHVALALLKEIQAVESAASNCAIALPVSAQLSSFLLQSAHKVLDVWLLLALVA